MGREYRRLPPFFISIRGHSACSVSELISMRYHLTLYFRAGVDRFQTMILYGAAVDSNVITVTYNCFNRHLSQTLDTLIVPIINGVVFVGERRLLLSTVPFMADRDIYLYFVAM